MESTRYTLKQMSNNKKTFDKFSLVLDKDRKSYHIVINDIDLGIANSIGDAIKVVKTLDEKYN